MKLLLLLQLLPFCLVAQTNSKGASLAMVFVNALDSSQKVKAVFSFEDMSRYEWHYLPANTAVRQGIAIRELDSSQRQKVHALLSNYLSNRGYAKANNIINNEYLLKELEPDNINRIPQNYYVAFYGNPGRDSIWGWKFSGHHVALNFTIINNQLAFAPFFFGIYPAEIPSGTNKGKRIIKDEEDLGIALINQLTNQQKTKAIFRIKAFTDIVTTNAATVKALDTVGIPAHDLTAAQKIALNKLIVVYLSAMPAAIAHKRMKQILAEDFNAIRFGWAGSLKLKEPHYYRIQGKTFLIEFDNTQHNANHIHTVWRDFDGDFGTDLLKEHYLNSKHHNK
jgi:Protein of unknown function (DUF3500)